MAWASNVRVAIIPSSDAACSQTQTLVHTISLSLSLDSFSLMNMNWDMEINEENKRNLP